MEQLKGIEPSYSRSQPGARPLSYNRGAQARGTHPPQSSVRQTGLSEPVHMAHLKADALMPQVCGGTMAARKFR